MASSLVPAVGWLGRYERPWLRADVLAGLTTSAVVIPKAMAYATVAGLPVQIGLYTALVPLVIYAALGTSRALSVTTTTTLGILCASALDAAVPNAEPARLIAASATLALLTGAVLLIARLFRLGFVANFVSDPVLTGFKAGIGLVIVLDQAFKLLGLHHEKANWIRDAIYLLRHLPETALATFLVGLAALVIVGVGLYYIHDGWTADFTKELKVGEMSPKARKAVIVLGRFGRIAQGIVFCTIGVLVMIAAVQYDPDKAKGLDGALKTLAGQPYGKWLLVFIALGLLAYGVYGLAEAKLRRVS